MKNEWEEIKGEYYNKSEIQQLQEEYANPRPEFEPVPQEYRKVSNEYESGEKAEERQSKPDSGRIGQLRKMVYMVTAAVSVAVISQTINTASSAVEMETIAVEDDFAEEDEERPITITTNYGAAITEKGDLYLWGNNTSGEIGDGTTENKHKPVKIMENVKSVSSVKND